MTASTTADALRTGLTELSELAQDEYGQDLAELIGEAEHDERALQRVSRLVGITVKQPFATPHAWDPSQSATGARRTWGLDNDKLRAAATQQPWQYALLDQMRTEDWIQGARGYQPATVAELASDANYERGFWWYLAKSAHRYICGNQQLEQQLQVAADEVRRQGGPAALVSRNALVGAATSSLSVALVQAVPWLSTAAAPVLTGLVIVICTIGVDGFCDWAADRLQDPEHMA